VQAAGAAVPPVKSSGDAGALEPSLKVLAADERPYGSFGERDSRSALSCPASDQPAAGRAW